jgi:hypothetical protein
MTKKPEIKVTQLTEPFWAGVREHKFLLQYDPAANRYQFYPRPLSLFSDGSKMEWREASGLGTLVARSLCYAPAPGFEDEVPYLLGIVELDEGPRVFAPVVAGEDQPKIGTRMRIVWQQVGEQTLYQFAPA